MCIRAGEWNDIDSLRNNHFSQYHRYYMQCNSCCYKTKHLTRRDAFVIKILDRAHVETVMFLPCLDPPCWTGPGAEMHSGLFCCYYMQCNHCCYHHCHCLGDDGDKGQNTRSNVASLRTRPPMRGYVLLCGNIACYILCKK